MNITQHAKLRYVQRIKGVQDDREAKQYIAQNDERVTAEIDKLIEFGECIWEGQLGEYKPSRYLLNGDIVLVTDQANLALVTVYRCDFGFPPTVNKQTIKGLTSEIAKLRTKVDKARTHKQAEADKLQVEIDHIATQIAEYQAHIAQLEAKQRYVQAELDLTENEPKQIEANIAGIAAKLIYSVELRKDMLVAKYAN